MILTFLFHVPAKNQAPSMSITSKRSPTRYLHKQFYKRKESFLFGDELLVWYEWSGVHIGQ
jgi:hypothetical protein